MTEVRMDDDLDTRETAEEEERRIAAEMEAAGEPEAGVEAGERRQTLADLAAATPDQSQEEDGQQLFVLEGNERVGLGTLIKRGTPVEYEFKLGGKGIKGDASMGLLAFNDPDRVLVVPGRAGKVEVDPTYNPDGSVKKVTIRQHFKPSTAYDSRASSAREVMGLPPVESEAE